MSWHNAWKWSLDSGWFLFLLIILIHFWRKKRNFVLAKSWVIVKGHVTSCKWAEVGHSLWPKIEYSFHVGDVEIIGDDLFVDSSANNPGSKHARDIAYQTAVAFKENREIDVYYNPDNTRQSALDVSVPFRLNFILTVIWLLIAVHVASVFTRYVLH